MISIIVPIYNVEKYIKQCVDSIIAQTYKDIEIILVDDGSPDNCPEICDDYAKQDSRIKVIHKQNEGICAARKSGLKISNGDYVCFVDGDDWIEPDMYECVADSINSSNADCIITQFYSSFPDKDIVSDTILNKPLYGRTDIMNEIIPKMLFSGKYYSFGIMPNCWSKIIKKDILAKFLFDIDDSIRLGEDASFVYPSLMDCQSIAFIDKALYHYRINPNSMTKAYDDNLHKIYFLPYQALATKSKELGVDLSSQLPYYLLYLVNFVIRNEANAGNPKSKDERNAVLDEIINNQAVCDAMEKIDMSLLPKHTKLLVTSIKKRSRFMLQGYIKLLRNFL